MLKTYDTGMVGSLFMNRSAETLGKNALVWLARSANCAGLTKSTTKPETLTASFAQ